MKAKTISAATIACSALLLSGCGAPIVDQLRLPNADPAQAVLRSVSSKAQNSVSLEWDEDPAATGYRLYRAQSEGGTRDIIYQGAANSFDDVETPAPAEEEGCFFYYLEKVRGSQSFPLSAPEMGFKSATVIDSFEPNDTADAASPLGRTVDANMYFFRSGTTVKMDYDWYRIDVGPHQTTSIQVSNADTSPNPSVDLLVQDAGVKPCPFNSPIDFTNQGDSAKTFKFRLSLTPAQYLSNAGAFFAYRIEVKTIVLTN